ncbi:hypothetical protein LENED_005770 [Lentinula edodes]|uniref:Uncharacterized protein n=1 Tax=Lentinula edodes TaxID=5353 RepID=A0A1Q3E9X3_LENED|nr:hypothetical protein LENED_005770 [Lentinula edodes]
MYYPWTLCAPIVLSTQPPRGCLTTPPMQLDIPTTTNYRTTYTHKSTPSHTTRRVQNRSPQLSTSSQRFFCPERRLLNYLYGVYRALTVGFVGGDHLSIFITLHLCVEFTIYIDDHYHYLLEAPSEWDSCQPGIQVNVHSVEMAQIFTSIRLHISLLTHGSLEDGTHMYPVDSSKPCWTSPPSTVLSHASGNTYTCNRNKTLTHTYAK